MVVLVCVSWRVLRLLSDATRRFAARRPLKDLHRPWRLIDENVKQRSILRCQVTATQNTYETTSIVLTHATRGWSKTPCFGQPSQDSSKIEVSHIPGNDIDHWIVTFKSISHDAPWAAKSATPCQGSTKGSEAPLPRWKLMLAKCLGSLAQKVAKIGMPSCHLK